MALPVTAMLERAASAAREAIRGISGCEIVSIEHLPATSRHPNSRLVIHLHGWSPTLHSITMRSSQPWPGAPSKVAGDVQAALAELTRVQATRAARGRRLGTDLPMQIAALTSIGSIRAGADALEIGHVHIDRALLDLASRDGLDSALELLRRRVLGLHSSVQRLDSRTVPRELNRLSTGLSCVDDATGRPVISFRETVMNGVTLAGSRIVIDRQSVPETVAVALVGRHLGELIRFPTAAKLADRRIARVRNDHDPKRRQLMVDLEPDTVAIGTLGVPSH